MRRIGIVDLMAVTARGAAAAQFSRLAAAGEQLDIVVVDLDPADGGRADWSAIAGCDVLIVTGAEPRTADLRDDPTYAIVERILAGRPVPVVFSCLSAHAALHQLYSTDRRKLPVKRSGLFRHRVVPGALTAGLSATVTLPHSRWHTIDPIGVTPLLVTDDDWAVAVSGNHLFLQAHPEYAGDTLFREYRRDVRRYLERASGTYPSIPVGLPTETVEALEEFAARRRSMRHFPELPKLSGGWLPDAALLISNWVSAVFADV
jgi:homoserine O-succinyltransferase